MKRLGILWLAVLLVFALGLGGLAQAQQTAAPAERQAYQKKAVADLDKLQQRINDLKVKGEQAAPQMKRTYNKTVLSLQKQAIDAKDKLAALEKASEAEWSRIQADTAKALDDLKRGVQEAERQL